MFVFSVGYPNFLRKKKKVFLPPLFKRTRGIISRREQRRTSESFPDSTNSTRKICLEELIMKLEPLNDRVLVKRLESEEKTAGGLYIPDTAKEKPSKGQVIAVGPGKLGDDGKRVALAVKAGDEVLFNKYAGTEVKLDGVDHLVMREEDILAIIK